MPTPTPSQTFDTGRPENPYPSISGKFVGTIKTKTKIIAINYTHMHAKGLEVILNMPLFATKHGVLMRNGMATKEIG